MYTAYVTPCWLVSSSWRFGVSYCVCRQRPAISEVTSGSLFYTWFWPGVISVFRRKVDTTCALLGCYAAGSGDFLTTFREHLSVPPSRVQKSAVLISTLFCAASHCATLNVQALRSFEASLAISQSTRRSITEHLDSQTQSICLHYSLCGPCHLTCAHKPSRSFRKSAGVVGGRGG